MRRTQSHLVLMSLMLVLVDPQKLTRLDNVGILDYIVSDIGHSLVLLVISVII